MFQTDALNFEFLTFEFVSYFGFRASNFYSLHHFHINLNPRRQTQICEGLNHFR